MKDKSQQNLSKLLGQEMMENDAVFKVHSILDHEVSTVNVEVGVFSACETINRSMRNVSTVYHHL